MGICHVLFGFYPHENHVFVKKLSFGRKERIFEVFRKVLSHKWLQECLSVIGRFTKSKFAKGKVSSRERPCFVVRKVMFQTTKHNLWRGQNLPFAL